jgi:hypothetical protein
LLLKAKSIIQRDAILSELESQGINAFASPRDMSRKIADHTVDLALEGYSVFFDGFPIYVNELDKAAADEIANRLLRETQQTPMVSSDESPHLRRFFFCAIFSLMLPAVMHVFGAYHLYRAFKTGEKIRPLQFTVGLLLFLLMPFMGLIYLLQ